METPSKPFAWSYSALKDFEICPRRWAETKVFKRYKETVGEAGKWGMRVHEDLARALQRGDPLPKPIEEKVGRTVRALRSLPYRLMLVEARAGFDRDMKFLGWDDEGFFHNKVWFRCILDVGVVLENWKDVIILDWKTGKPRPDDTQLRLFAKAMFSAFDDLQRATVGFVWLQTGRTDKIFLTRDEIEEWWEKDMQPRVCRMEYAYSKGDFQPKPGGMCSKWCPVRREHCVYSERT